MILLTVLAGVVAVAAWYRAVIYKRAEDIWYGPYPDLRYPSATPHLDTAVASSGIHPQPSRPSASLRSTKRSTAPTRSTSSSHPRPSSLSQPQYTVTVERIVEVERTVTETIVPMASIGHGMGSDPWEDDEEYDSGAGHERGGDTDDNDDDHETKDNLGGTKRGKQVDLVHVVNE